MNKPIEQNPWLLNDRKEYGQIFYFYETELSNTYLVLQTVISNRIIIIVKIEMLIFNFREKTKKLSTSNTMDKFPSNVFYADNFFWKENISVRLIEKRILKLKLLIEKKKVKKGESDSETFLEKRLKIEFHKNYKQSDVPQAEKVWLEDNCLPEIPFSVKIINELNEGLTGHSSDHYYDYVSLETPSTEEVDKTKTSKTRMKKRMNIVIVAMFIFLVICVFIVNVLWLKYIIREH